MEFKDWFKEDDHDLYNYPEEAMEEAWNAAKQGSEWISVEDGLPQTRRIDITYSKSINVLVICGGVQVSARYEFGSEGGDTWSHWYCDFIEDTIERVTHWMKLPESPKEGKS